MNIGVNQSMIGDDDVVFEPSSWHIKIDFINQFISNNNVLISVLGEKGTGKTTFANFLRKTMTSNVNAVLLTSTPLFEALPFIEQICVQLNMEVKLSFIDIVNEINARQTRTLIIIDNAEELPESFVTEILDALMTQEGSGYCHVCILSDFSLVSMTSRLARETYQDMIHSIELQPLNEAETKDYVLTRMAAINSNKIELSDEWLHQFYELTEGNIMGINTQMMGFFVNKSELNIPFYKRYLPYGYIPVLGIAMAGVVYFISSQSSMNDPEMAELIKNSMQTAQIELPLTSEIPFYSVSSTHLPMETIAAQPIDIQLANQDTDSTMGEASAAIPWEKPQLLVEVAEETSTVQTVVVAHKKASPVMEKIKSPKQLKIAQSKAVHGASKSASSTGQFTIQLLATRDKNELNRLAKQYRSQDGFKIRRFDNQGVVWYVLTRGDYTQKPLAQQAMTTLPRNLAQLKPWVRSTANLKNIG